MQRTSCALGIILFACMRSSSAPVPPGGPAAPRAAAPNDAAALALSVVPTTTPARPVEKVPCIEFAGNKDNTEPLEIHQVRRGYPTAAALCDGFIADAKASSAEVASTFSFKQLQPACVDVGAAKGFTSNGIFTDARVLRTARISRKADRLALKVAGLWFETPVAWNEQESESATPPWKKTEPESFEVVGKRWIAYLGGADLSHNEGIAPDGGTSPTLRLLRGAVVCEFMGDVFRCVEWNPTDRTPLGTKEAARGFNAWKSLPWKESKPITDDFASQMFACARP
jgi:hypothetical protein